MEIVQSESVEWEDRPSPVRVGRFQFKTLLVGKQEGTPQNFSLTLSNMWGDFFSPRHKHGFDQIRLQITGGFDYSQDGVMEPGTVGYFPEGTKYGPHKKLPESDLSTMLTLQFPGSSANPFMSERQFQRGTAVLKAKGEFKEGVYRPYGEGAHPIDAHQAVWEEVFGRPMVSPKQRYERPILIRPINFDWVPTEEVGVNEKALGTFNELRNELRIIKLDAGAVHRALSMSIYFVLHGKGHVGASPWSTHTTICLRDDETAILQADAPSEIFIMKLPGLLRSQTSQSKAA